MRELPRMMSVFEARCEIDGETATAAALAVVARFNHGHFTSLQVRGGAARGLDLHLARLSDATRTLYGATLEHERVRDLLRHALHGLADASARISVFATNWNVASMAFPTRVSVLINVQPPAVADRRPLRLRCVEHERFLPQIKHVGTFPLLQLRAAARRDGFDDVLFFDRHGNISEGTVWNIGFRDGERIVWPDAAQLRGISMQLLEQGLARAGLVSERRTIPRDALSGLSAAFVCNASGVGQPVASIDDIPFAQHEHFTRTLIDCYESNPWQTI